MSLEGIDAAAVTANYERESAQETPTATQLHAHLSNLIAQGYGSRKVFLMRTGEGDGLTHADPIKMVFASEEYDGEIIWII